MNVAALTKPHAVEHLTADLSSYNVDITLIRETHLKSRHSDSVFTIPGYMMLRRDRAGRRGGGVALYVRTTMPLQGVWTYSADNPTYELLWADVGDMFIGALYHPPRPLYTPDSLFYYLQGCIDEITCNHPAASLVLAGDFNQLSHDALVDRTGLTQIVKQPTRGANIFDRIYVSCPLHYDSASCEVGRPQRSPGGRGVYCFSASQSQ